MYSKLSYFFLLVGLISQTIAVQYLQDEIDNSIISDEILSPFETTTETTDSIEDKHDIDLFVYLEKCVKRGNSSIFDLDLIQRAREQIADPLNHVDDSLLLNETEQVIQASFDFVIIDVLENLNDSQISESMYQATKQIADIIFSVKRSDLKPIIRRIAQSSKGLIEALTTNKKDIDELIQSMKCKVVTLSMMKEDPSKSTYLLDLLQSMTSLIDRYEKQDEFNGLAGALTLTLEQAKMAVKIVMQLQISTDTEVVEPLIQVIDYLANKISYIVGMNISDQNKFSAVRCMTEDSILAMFMQIFMFKFHSEVDS